MARNISPPKIHDFHEEFIVFFWFLILTTYLAWQRRFPYIYDDEYGVLGAAAAFAGYDWTTPTDMPFYGFGLSILIAPLYALSLDPTSLYRAVLAVNGLLVATSALLALRIIKSFCLPISSLSRIGIISAAFSYPSVLFYAGMAMGETMLLLCFMLLIYSLATLIGYREVRYTDSFLLGIGLGMAPYAHSRGLVFWLAVFPIIGWVLRKKLLSTKSAIWILVSFFLTLAVFASVKIWLIENFYSEVRMGTASATDFMSSRLTLFQPEQLSAIARVAFGQFAYLMTSTFGLFLVGMGGVLAAILSACPDQKTNRGIAGVEVRRQAIVAALVGLATIFMFAVSVLQMGSPVRADHYFYGRYNETIVPPVLVAALLLFSTWSQGKSRNRLSWFAVGLFLALLLMLGVRHFPAEIFELPMIWNTISSWFVHIQGPWKIQPLNIALGALIGGGVLALLLVFSRHAFIFGVATMFTAVALLNFKIQHAGGDRAWSWYANLGKLYGSVLSGQRLEVVGDGNQISGQALQYSMPDAKVIFGTNSTIQSDARLDLKGNSCDKYEVLARGANAVLCFLNTSALTEQKARNGERFEMPLARTKPPANIQILQQEINAGGWVQRVCAFAEKAFFTSWARYCLPKLIVRVQRNGVHVDEYQQLGIFMTDSPGNWLFEMRAGLDMEALALGEALTIRVPVQFGWKTPPGVYTLHARILDAAGWDERSIASTRIIIK